jgi:hypothetical protein
MVERGQPTGQSQVGGQVLDTRPGEVIADARQLALRAWAGLPGRAWTWQMGYTWG